MNYARLMLKLALVERHTCARWANENDDPFWAAKLAEAEVEVDHRREMLAVEMAIAA